MRKKVTNYEKQIKKGRMRDVYNELDLCMQKNILLELECLVSENNHPNPEIEQSILPGIAIYQTLLKHDYSKVEALNMIRNSVKGSYMVIANFAHVMSKLPFFFSLFRVMCRLSMKEGVNEKGWTFKWIRNDKTAMVWECHFCAYANVFAKYDVRELAPIFCECEELIYGNLKNAHWSRTKTIGRGADVCNFSFYNK